MSKKAMHVRKSKEFLPSFLVNAVLYILLFDLAELWLRISSSTEKNHFFGIGLFYTIGFTFVMTMLWYCIASLFKTKVRLILLDIAFCFASLLCMVQIVYFDIFENYFILFSIKALGDAVGQFWKVMFSSIWHCMPFLLLCGLGVVFYFLILRKEIAYHSMKTEGEKKVFCHLTSVGVIRRIGGVILALITYLILLLFLALGSKAELKPHYLYFNNIDSVLSVRAFGAVNTFRLDIKYEIFGTKESIVTVKKTGTKKEKESNSKKPQKPVEYNTVKIDFDKLISESKSSAVIDLHKYFKEQEPTAKNEYTGKFKGKNVIQITAEAFYTCAIDPELTPTLYKMAHDGLEFTNYYSPGWGVSTLDGEYVNLLSTIPKSGVWSMWRAKNNNLYYSLGNSCHRLGYNCMAYHNNTYDYYSRDESHDNLWVKWKAVGNGLDGFKFNGWPRSDVELVELTTLDFLGENHKDPFAIYYLTVSGHANYGWSENAISSQNKEVVANLTDSEELKSYKACQYELEKAMTLLLKRLEEAGELDDTLIILAPDHYPYGLSESALTEILGAGYTEFDMYKNTLIMYNPTFEHKVIDKPCYSIDILPTALNLMGIDYDSRLLMGTDILSDSDGLVIFSDRSWITEYGLYDCPNDHFIKAEGKTVPEGYVQEMCDIVRNKFNVSTMMLDNDYWGKVFGPKG